MHRKLRDKNTFGLLMCSCASTVFLPPNFAANIKGIAYVSYRRPANGRGTRQ
jgi:hypothetical protein